MQNFVSFFVSMFAISKLIASKMISKLTMSFKQPLTTFTKLNLRQVKEKGLNIKLLKVAFFELEKPIDSVILNYFFPLASTL